MINVVNKLVNQMVSQLKDEAGVDGLFPGFNVYKTNRREHVGFPMVIVIPDNVQRIQNFVGGEGINMATITLAIFFSGREAGENVDREYMDDDEIIYVYMERCEQFLDNFKFPEEMDIDNIEFRMEPRFPSEGDFEGYGLAFTIGVAYKDVLI